MGREQMAGAPVPRTVSQIRSLVMAPERRVSDRNDQQMALHVRRTREAREKADAKSSTALGSFSPTDRADGGTRSGSAFSR